MYRNFVNGFYMYKQNFNQILYKNVFTGKKEETRKKKINPLFDREFFKIRRV